MAAIAETRPLMVAEPILRAPRPEMVEESKRASSAAFAVLARVRRTKRTIIRMCIRLLLWRDCWEFEFSLVNRNVGFRFLDNDLLFIRRSFRTGFNRERKKHAVDFFVIAKIGFHFHL